MGRVTPIFILFLFLFLQLLPPTFTSIANLGSSFWIPPILPPLLGSHLSLFLWHPSPHNWASNYPSEFLLPQHRPCKPTAGWWSLLSHKNNLTFPPQECCGPTVSSLSFNLSFFWFLLPNQQLCKPTTLVVKLADVVDATSHPICRLQVVFLFLLASGANATKGKPTAGQ